MSEWAYYTRIWLSDTHRPNGIITLYGTSFRRWIFQLIIAPVH